MVHLNLVIDQVGKDKSIDRNVLIETLEAAILTAAKKVFGPQRQIEAHFNEDKGEVELFQIMEVVEEIMDPFREINLDTALKADPEAQAGDELGFQIFYRDEDMEAARQQDEEYGDILQLQSERRSFGRIAAQTAKQVIIQRVREAERENVYNEYRDRRGEIITGIARRFEAGNIVVDLGRAEAILPKREQCPRESYRPGDRVQAYVLDVQKIGKGPQIILSRTDTNLLLKLFEMEVPEIHEDIVRIEGAAREPGSRAKIAVSSRDLDVDPVGACVGMKGSRVQAVVQELRGEKIDIIPFDRDPVRYVINAIQPADVSKVVMDADNGVMELIVPDDQLSLAIGRKGQNVRLAAQLTGWKLEILSETKVQEMESLAREAMITMPSLNEERIEDLFRLGYTSIESLADADAEELSHIPGITTEQAREIIAGATEILTAGKPQPEADARPLTERERLLSLRGVGERTIEALTKAGFNTVEDLVLAGNEDKLVVSTGLGLKKAREIIAAATALIEGKQPDVSAEEDAETEPQPQSEIEAEAQDQGEEDPGESSLETVDENNGEEQA